MTEEPQGRGRVRRRADHTRGPADSQFDSVIEQLVQDRGWRRRVGLVHLRHRCSWVLRSTLHGFAELGCWFAFVPPQRCARTVTSTHRSDT